MRSFYFILLYINSCCFNSNRDASSARNNEIESSFLEKKDTLKLHNNIDRVDVECLFFGDFNNESFLVSISNRELFFINDKDVKRKILDKNTKERLVNYVNEFYIIKGVDVILSKEIEPFPITDYPIIRVRIFKNSTEHEFVKHTLYSNLHFNPDFLEFYKLLNDLNEENFF